MCVCVCYICCIGISLPYGVFIQVPLLRGLPTIIK